MADTLEESVEIRNEAVKALEERLKVALAGETPDVCIVALGILIAENLVKVSTLEPPEAPAPMLSMVKLSMGIQVIDDAIKDFVSTAVRRAEAEGVTLVVRHRPKKEKDAEEG